MGCRSSTGLVEPISITCLYSIKYSHCVVHCYAVLICHKLFFSCDGLIKVRISEYDTIPYFQTNIMIPITTGINRFFIITYMHEMNVYITYYDYLNIDRSTMKNKNISTYWTIKIKSDKKKIWTTMRNAIIYNLILLPKKKDWLNSVLLFSWSLLS